MSVLDFGSRGVWTCELSACGNSQRKNNVRVGATYDSCRTRRVVTVAVGGALAALAVARKGSKVVITVSGKGWLIQKGTYAEEKLVGKDEWET